MKFGIKYGDNHGKFLFMEDNNDFRKAILLLEKNQCNSFRSIQPILIIHSIIHKNIKIMAILIKKLNTSRTTKN